MMNDNSPLRLALPKGRMQSAVFALLRDAGLQLTASDRDYRPRLCLPGLETKILKPQSIIQMLAAGSRDLGFAGADWVAEFECDLVKLVDTELNPVQLVAAAPEDLLEDGNLPSRPLIVASEYPRLAQEWMQRRKLRGKLVKSFGATEVLPPEDADCIIDNCASGSTLRANGLVVIDEIMTSSTRLYASRMAWRDPTRRQAIEDLVTLLSSVLDARRRALIEINASPECTESLARMLPCLREPTISPLHDGKGYAIKAAVLRDRLWQLIPELKALGATDIMVSEIAQIVR